MMVRAMEANMLKVGAAQPQNAGVPKELLDAGVAHFEPVRVILFGSQVWREAGADSDIDLLVVLDDGYPRRSSAGKPHSRRARTFTGRSTSCPAGGAGSRTSAR